jgi:small subunit ribosomal protein S16
VSVKIRLMRVGKKKQPTYRVVVADARSPRDGRYIEIIGQYGPRQEPAFVAVDDEKALAWLRKGAQPTEQVQRLLTEIGVWERYQTERGQPFTPPKRGAPAGPKQSKKQAAKAAGETPAAETPAAEAPAAETPAAETPAEGAGE